jgi:hypothetical protein
MRLMVNCFSGAPIFQVRSWLQESISKENQTTTRPLMSMFLRTRIYFFIKKFTFNYFTTCLYETKPLIPSGEKRSQERKLNIRLCGVMQGFYFLFYFFSGSFKFIELL